MDVGRAEDRGTGIIMDRVRRKAECMMTGNDPSHDFHHVLRVRATALELARLEAERHPRVDVEVVEAAAYLHDVADWKYPSSDAVPLPELVRLLLAEWSAERAEHVLRIVQGIGFKEELPSEVCGEPPRESARERTIEFDIVQDADRLDAIGAIGIARAFAYGSRRGARFFDPAIPVRPMQSREEYMRSDPTTTLNHFHEKLLRLSDRMKTEAGYEMAKQRHAFMLAFLDQFHSELGASLRT